MELFDWIDGQTFFFTHFIANLRLDFLSTLSLQFFWVDQGFLTFFLTRRTFETLNIIDPFEESKHSYNIIYSIFIEYSEE